MYILSGDRKSIINSDFVERFCVVEKPDAALVVASYSPSSPNVATMARYKDAGEAKGVLNELLLAMVGGQVYFEMPESRLFSEEQTIKDARVKRRGGS